MRGSTGHEEEALNELVHLQGAEHAVCLRPVILIHGLYMASRPRRTSRILASRSRTESSGDSGGSGPSAAPPAADPPRAPPPRLASVIILLAAVPCEPIELEPVDAGLRDAGGGGSSAACSAVGAAAPSLHTSARPMQAARRTQSPPMSFSLICGGCGGGVC